MSELGPGPGGSTSTCTLPDNLIHPSILFRRAAEVTCGQLQHRLSSTEQELQEEHELRQRSEHEALRLAVDRQRLSSALKVERLIKWVKFVQIFLPPYGVPSASLGLANLHCFPLSLTILAVHPCGIQTTPPQPSPTS